MTRAFVAYFEHEDDVRAATAAVHAMGLEIEDVYTPYAVHGMDEAMGLKPSRLGLVCFGGGALGLAFAALLQIYTSAVSWPLNVGGKSTASLPAFIPVGFELTVLCAALITVVALLLRTRLLPGRRARVLQRVTNDRFALVLPICDPRADATALRALCEQHGAVEAGLEEVP